MISELSEQGDINDKPRPIQHKIKLKNNKDYDQIKTDLSNFGYVVTKNSDNEIIVLHIAPLLIDKIKRNIDIIVPICDKYNAKYDGWNAKIVK